MGKVRLLLLVVDRGRFLQGDPSWINSLVLLQRSERKRGGGGIKISGGSIDMFEEEENEIREVESSLAEATSVSPSSLESQDESTRDKCVSRNYATVNLQSLRVNTK